MDTESVSANNDIDVDGLLSEIEAPSNEQLIEPGASPAQNTQQAQQASDFAFVVGGKEIKLDLAKDRDKLIKWAQQGYDAPNRIGELNKVVETYKSKEQQFKEWQEKYGPVDDYVRQNPEFWEHVTQTYQQLQAQKEQNPLHPVVGELQKRLEGLENIAQTFQSEREAQIAKQQDDQYMQEFTTLQKQYPKIDFSTPDESGKSLEYKVLEYAKDKGIREFAPAFRAFYHDELVKMAAEEAKEKLINDKQSKSKLGILGISPTPTKRISDSVKGKSYDNLYKEALSELGLE